MLFELGTVRRFQHRRRRGPPEKAIEDHQCVLGAPSEILVPRLRQAVQLVYHKFGDEDMARFVGGGFKRALQQRDWPRRNPALCCWVAQLESS